MRVKIGKYPYWWTTGNLEDWWYYKRYEKFRWNIKNRDKDKIDKAFDWLCEYPFQGWCNFINKFSPAERKIKIHIDRWDTWNMNNTLALIIAPMLKQLKETKHGAPYVYPEDVPAELRPSKEELAEYSEDGSTDENYFKRWDWVLDEMIWTFETYNTDWEAEFYSGEIDRISVPVDKDLNDLPEGTDEDDIMFYEWREGPNHTFEVDMEAKQKVQDRLTNGFKLFGKYYQNLWD